MKALLIVACVAALIPLGVAAVSVHQLATTPFDVSDVVFLVVNLAIAAFLVGYPLSVYRRSVQGGGRS